MVRKIHKKKTLHEEREASKPRKLTFCCILILHRLYFNQFILAFRINKRYVIHWKKGSCAVFVVHGTILQQWTLLLKNSVSIEKRKNFAHDCWATVPATVAQSCQWLLNNCASDCWTIAPVTVEQLCQWLLMNRTSHYWRIIPMTVDQSCQWVLNNRVPATIAQSCQWLLNNRDSDCWRIMPLTVEESR